MDILMLIPATFFVLAFITYFLQDKSPPYREVLDVSRDVKRDLVGFKVKEPILRQVMTEFNRQLQNCLLGNRRGTLQERGSSLESYDTYVQILPDGEERGRFLGLSLKGVNCHLLAVKIKESKVDSIGQRFRVPSELMGKSGTCLFDFIAEQISTFVTEYRLENKKLHLGFSSDFPVTQERLSVAILKSWTHGYHCSETVGKDIIRMLRGAIFRAGLHNVKVIGLITDVTGTLISCHWTDRKCFIGLKLDETANACYAERPENIAGFNGEYDIPLTIVNTQWINFGDNGELDFATTPFDRPGDGKGGIEFEVFDKIVAPGHMAEMLRTLLLRFAKKRILFGGTGSKKLSTRGSITPSNLYQIESELPGEYDNCRQFLKGLDIQCITDQDCANVRYICEALTSRSADFVGAALAALVNRTPYSQVTVGVEGSLHRYHPYYHERLEKTVTGLIDANKIFAIKPVVDGMNLGAALLAASYTRYYASEKVE